MWSMTLSFIILIFGLSGAVSSALAHEAAAHCVPGITLLPGDATSSVFIAFLGLAWVVKKIESLRWKVIVKPVHPNIFKLSFQFLLNTGNLPCHEMPTVYKTHREKLGFPSSNIPVGRRLILRHRWDRAVIKRRMPSCQVHVSTTSPPDNARLIHIFFSLHHCYYILPTWNNECHSVGNSYSFKTVESCLTCGCIIPH